MTTPGAADLLREVGLLADGPARWGSPAAGRGPGVYVVELVELAVTAPLDLSRVGKWLERLPDLRLDGARPTSRALAGRLATLWWPEARVVYAASTAASLGRRVAALAAHVPGERQPHPDGQWLHLLRSGVTLRVWWAETDAPEEYLDAVLDAFATSHGPPSPGRPAGALDLPWATTRRPTGERQAHGITGSILPGAPRPVEPEARVVELAPGDAEGARVEERGTGTTRRAPRVPPGHRATTPRAASAPRTRRSPTPAPPPTAPEPVELSPAALTRLEVELDELTRVRRPEVVARIKAARELGDLRENAEYQAAREEQSFLEGRVQALEDRLRRAVVVTDRADGRIGLGSVVTVETAGEETTFTIVGSAEGDPAAGRLSAVSPVGAALLGRGPGDEVDVRTPRGSVRYRVVSIA